MILRNLKTIDNRPLDLEILGERIAGMGKQWVSKRSGLPEIFFSEALVFPGLINSHDHLDFNLFPALGRGPYANYTEWGRDIHREYKGLIEKVMKVPFALRRKWGIYKNLMCGITTVVHHGKKGSSEPSPITVLESAQSLHSLRFEKLWKIKLNLPFHRNRICNIHIGEGTDKMAHAEIGELFRWNLMKRPLVGIHGISMTPEQASRFKGLVWCPVSNKFLFQATADIDQLRHHTRILFGTDATLTAGWNAWDHIRMAAGQVDDPMEVFRSLTSHPAMVWNLESGLMAPQKRADLVLAQCPPGHSGTEAFFRLNPSDILMVWHRGSIRLFDETLFPTLQRLGLPLQNFGPMAVGGSTKFIEGHPEIVLEDIRKFLPHAGIPVSLAMPALAEK